MYQNIISDKIPYSQLENVISQHNNFLNENNATLVVRSVTANAGLETFIVVSTFKK
jgi:hypothetical protein